MVPTTSTLPVLPSLSTLGGERNVRFRRRQSGPLEPALACPVGDRPSRPSGSSPSLWGHVTESRYISRRQGKSCSSAAGRLRSDAVGTSPSAISLAEHRVEFGVGPDLPDLLRAAAGDGDLGSPMQRL